MNKVWILLGLLLCLSLPPLAGADTLLDIYARALRNDPGIREAQANREATLQSRPQARGLLLPQIEANASYIDDSTDGARNTTFGGVNLLTKFNNKTDGWRWNLQLSQTLFRWDQWVSLRKAGRQVAQAEADYLTAQQDLMVRVANAYFNVLAAQDTLASEQASKDAITRQLEQAKKRFEVGLIAITDVQEAQAAYDQAVASEISAKRSLATSHQFLREIVGEFRGTLNIPKKEIPLISPDPEIEDEWVEIALRQNPAVLSGEFAADIATDDKRVALTSHFPTIDLVATHSETDLSGTGTTTGVSGIPTVSPIGTKSTDDQIELRFRLPVFSGGSTSAKVREATFRQRAARERYEKAIRQTERETRDAYLGVVSEISRVKALKQALESAQTALEATEAGFEVGTRTTVDVLNQRQQLFIADVNYSRSRYDYIINILKLKQAAGSLSVKDLQEINNWLEP